MRNRFFSPRYLHFDTVLIVVNLKNPITSSRIIEYQCNIKFIERASDTSDNAKPDAILANIVYLL